MIVHWDEVPDQVLEAIEQVITSVAHVHQLSTPQMRVHDRAVWEAHNDRLWLRFKVIVEGRKQLVVIDGHPAFGGHRTARLPVGRVERSGLKQEAMVCLGLVAA